jgi:hypothetical protein
MGTNDFFGKGNATVQIQMTVSCRYSKRMALIQSFQNLGGELRRRVV